jgi:DNA-binding MarR family transcriptional regulator
MRDESNQEPTSDIETERLVVLAVVEGEDGCSRGALLADLADIDPDLVEQAIASLERAGLLEVTRTRLRPTAALRRLDDLGFICL